VVQGGKILTLNQAQIMQKAEEYRNKVAASLR